MPKNIFQNSYLYLLGYRDNLSLGKCFHYGQHVKKDLVLARSYYLKAAQQGSAGAFGQLHILTKEEGHASEADYYLGRKHECLTQWQDALTVYQRAGEAGYVFAFYRAGMLFKRNRVSTPAQTIKRDLVTELAWYRKAASVYSKHALNALLVLSKKESKAALHLAQMYESGEIGNKKILSTAVSYYEKASEMGDPIAAYRLGQLYEIGEETFKSDQRKAFAYYLIAAKNQDKKALEGLERIIKKLNDTNLQLQLADVYENSFRKTELALKAFKELADKGNKIALERINRLANRYVSCAYELGSAYELNHHYRKAFSYYLIAAKKRDKKSLKGLESVISKLDDLALQFQLADVYENSFNKKELALKSFKNLADKGNKKALDRINSLANSSISYACELGRSYESSNSYDKAFAYYLIAAKKRDENSLEGLERTISKLNDATLQFQLAEVYEKSFNKKELALKYFKILADQGNTAALARMILLAKSDANCAYELAKSYKNEVSNKENAYQYYVFAMQNNHSHASDDLTALAESGDSEAQYALGYLYYHAKKNFYKAIHWCLLAAEQQHDKAIDYIKNTTFPSEYYLVLANSYEKGKKVNINKENALYFYEKALIEKNKEAAFCLGQCYQFDNEEKAFAYFIKAVQWGHTEAFFYLERLASELDSITQLQLANLYRDSPFNNPYKALYWSRQAIIASDDNTVFPDEVLVKVIEDTEKVISFENLNLLARKMAHEPKLTVPSFLLK